MSIPYGVSVYRDKIFVSLPRRLGVPVTLATIELKGNPPYLNPELIPYPNYEIQSVQVKFKF
jgi:hypothetical protein